MKYPHHEKVLKVLACLDSDILASLGCFFGGGTAISLLLKEHRLSDDVDFLCTDDHCFSVLRSFVSGSSLGRILRQDSNLKVLRDVRVDKYGIRAVVESEGTPIKLEIVRGERDKQHQLKGVSVVGLPILVLSQDDLYAEKMMANADRGHDYSLNYRDAIDLAAMEATWGPVSERALNIVKYGYQDRGTQSYDKIKSILRDNPEKWQKSCKQLRIDEPWQDKIGKIFGIPSYDWGDNPQP